MPHVQHDYFPWFNESDHCFLALSLLLRSSLLDDDNDDKETFDVAFSFFRYRIKTWRYASGWFYSSCKNFTHWWRLQIQPGVWGNNTTISLLIPGVYHVPKNKLRFCFLIRFYVIGHFRVHLRLHLKARLSAKSLLLKSVFIHIEIRTNYHNKSFALRLALKERLRGTRKWPIHNDFVPFIGTEKCSREMSLVDS